MNQPATELDQGSRQIVLSGHMTVSDAIAAHRLRYRARRYLVVLVAAITTAFVAVLIAVAVSTRPYSAESANIKFAVACFIFGALVCMPFAVDRYRLRKLARNKLGIFANTHTTFSLERITPTVSHATLELEWPVFSAYRANDTVALLFFAGSNTHWIVARSKLSDASEGPELIALIESKLPAK